MRRSGALTLGAILMLGGVTGGRGDQLSGSVESGGSSSSGGFALPSLPDNWNWADLPVRMTASETVSYNTNIFSLPNGTSLPNGEPKGDFTSTSSYGLSTRANFYGQQFFFDGSFGVIRYLHQTGNDSNIYSFNPGVNWTITSRCSGMVSGNFTRTNSTLVELVGVGINYATTTSLSETGSCAVSNGYSVIVNTGISRITNTNPIDAINNAQTEMIAAGLEYAKGDDTLTLLATKSDTNFINRTTAATLLRLSKTTVFHTFDATYVRQINPNLSVNARLGLVGVTNAFTLGLPKTLLPIYSIGITWAATPKTSLGLTASRTVSPPTTLIANAEVSYNTALTLTYQATPKIGFNGSASAGYTSGAFTPGLAAVLPGTTLATFAGKTNYYAATAGVSYAMTPFISAALNAVFSERIANHLITPDNVFTVSLNYRPY
jgi:hypothetical protein